MPTEDPRVVLERIVNAEIAKINIRRGTLLRPRIAPRQQGAAGFASGARTRVLDVTALALSGGGIRSASFSLGVLQALNEHNCLDRIDYLSTVSGGGYIGTALTATMTESQGDFVFGKSTLIGTGVTPADVMDSPQVGHLRNYSNYLMPFGMRDVITALAIITRGLVANGAIVLGFALLIAAMTVLGNPLRSELLLPNLFHNQLKDIYFLSWVKDMYFGVTLVLALIGLPLFYFWAIARSMISPPSDTAKSAFRFWWILIVIAYLILAAVVAVGPFAATDAAGVGIGFMAVILSLLVVAWDIGWRGREPQAQAGQQAPAQQGRTFPGFHHGWIAITIVYVVSAVAFLVLLRNSSVLFEASLLLLPTSCVLVLWARLVGPAQWTRRRHGDEAEFRTWAPTFFASYLLLIAAFVVFEFQPFVIAGMFDLYDTANASVDTNHSMLAAFIKWAATIATPMAALVTFFREQIGTLFKSVTSSSRVSTKMLAAAVSAGTWIGGAAVPLLIWIGFLYLCFWGIENDGKPKTNDTPPPRPAIHGTIKIEGPSIDLNASIKCGPGERDDCAQPPARKDKEVGRQAHAPTWLINAAEFAAKSYGKVAPYIRPAGGWLDSAMSNRWVSRLLRPLTALFQKPMTGLYAFAAIILLWLSWWLRPNANSLHQLYRDRLSKAFLFDPRPDQDGERSGFHSAVDPSFKPIGTMLLSKLTGDDPRAPYHLINATLNVQGSDYANRRGRNSDFFLFSPCFVGSQATGYATTQDMERLTNLDLATAMTISGAAFSPNAGAASISALKWTLALLNIRTGYWLRNPGFIAGDMDGPRRPFSDSNLYLWAELTSRLREDSEEVFLSDGGHIENLGIYELLRRRCRIIIVVDAEADPSLRYPSFITLQRYARIDLGVRINMPWDAVRTTTLEWMGYTGDPTAEEQQDAQPPEPSSGPHVSIGTIEYDGDERGWLVYIKSSLTGDENDYVRDYARRYEAFPHESTGDQFFSEEQFEVYRALGFHIAIRLLNGKDKALVYDDGQSIELNLKRQHPNIDPIRAALNLFP